MSAHTERYHWLYVGTALRLRFDQSIMVMGV